MNSKKWIAPVAASLLAFGSVSLGSAFETEAVAANQSWTFQEECGQGGCDQEEADEYYRNGAYGNEVQSEPGPGNREEMLELTAHSQGWCHQMFVAIARKRSHLYEHNIWCDEPRLGW
jgi:hypothetical protein